MSARVIIAIISICAVVTGGFASNIFGMLMNEELDRKRPGPARDSFTHWRSVRSFREYRNSCPDGKLHIYAMASYALAALGFIGFAVFMVLAYQPLVVHINSPVEGAAFTAPANIVISADASEGDYTVSRVDFYQGDTLLGSSTTAPHSVTWSNVPPGNYSLTAKATDDRGTTTSSDAVNITVNESGKLSPLR
jgi:hypothetical protein